MAALRAVLAGLSLALVVRADFQDDFRLRDTAGLRHAAPYDADHQRSLLEGPFHRAPVAQLSLADAASNQSQLEVGKVPAPQAPVAGPNAPAPAGVPATTNGTGPAVPASVHKSFFERNPVNPVFGLEQQPDSDEASKQLVEQDLGKLQRRKFRMRRHKGMKGMRKIRKLVDEETGPAGIAQEAYAQQRPEQAAAAGRLEALSGLKVELARAYIAAEEPEADSGPMELLCTVGYKEYASITWTVNGRPLENFIDRSTMTTVKNDLPVKVSKITITQLERLPSDNGKFVFECTALVDAQVTKATIALGSIIEDTCTANSQCEPRGATCSEGRCLCKPSQPVSLKSKHLTCRAAAGLGWPCDYSEQCVFATPNAVCNDRQICECASGFVRGPTNKSCDSPVPGNVNLIGQPCKANTDCHASGASCLNSVCACTNNTSERGGLCLTEEQLKMQVGVRGPNFLAGDDGIKTAQNDTRFTVAAAMINENADKKESTLAAPLGMPVRSSAGTLSPPAVAAAATSLAAFLLIRRG
ncbi:hypothetical protein V5799_029557 [Amblyomma americanum]|uniref:EB domain-containing protein n=1 Tax=Amblyomma americanum TaxID=6943 RepID=A0AAQ4EQV2_AMBAM